MKISSRITDNTFYTKKNLSDRIHEPFSTATTSKVFATLVKKYMLTIDNSYKVKAQNMNYFRKLFSTENRNLVT